MRFYGLDNEPGLWHETHRDVHPQHPGYDELRDLGEQYVAAIKAVDPLAQADVLGIFGREGIDLATLWEAPTPNQPGAFAFRMYRNYDGQGSAFGETSVHATSADQGQLAIYAALRKSDGALTLLIVNKTTSEQHANVALSSFTPAGSAAVYRYSAANLGAIARQTDQTVQGSSYSATFPATSITLIVLPAAAGPPSEQNQIFLPLARR